MNHILSKRECQRVYARIAKEFGGNQVREALDFRVSAEALAEHQCADHVCDAADERQWGIDRVAAECAQLRDEVAELVADDLFDGVLPEAEIAQRVQRPAALLLPETAFREDQSYDSRYADIATHYVHEYADLQRLFYITFSAWMSAYRYTSTY